MVAGDQIHNAAIEQAIRIVRANIPMPAHLGEHCSCKWCTAEKRIAYELSKLKV